MLQRFGCSTVLEQVEGEPALDTSWLSGLLMSNLSPNETHHCFLSYFPSGGINLLVFCLLRPPSATCWPRVCQAGLPALCLHWFYRAGFTGEQRPTRLLWVIRKGLFCALQLCLLIYLISLIYLFTRISVSIYIWTFIVGLQDILDFR